MRPTIGPVSKQRENSGSAHFVTAGLTRRCQQANPTEIYDGYIHMWRCIGF